ncbi:MAG: hypothetical protein K0R65_2895 [Crocinitomicaceae bacterium]|nr:hypothetical protein [Crocinitomicaceae bacterium]
MRKNILTLIFLCAAGIGSAFAQNDNGLIGKARGAAHECLQPFHGNDWIVNASVNTLSICFVSGFIQEVMFTAQPANQGPVGGEEGHPPALPIVIAVVQFGCDGEIISSSCY